MGPPDTNELGYTEGDYDQGYYENDYYHDEVALLRQQLEVALCANEELTYQVQEARKNPPGRPKKKESKKTLPTETETATV